MPEGAKMILTVIVGREDYAKAIADPQEFIEVPIDELRIQCGKNLHIRRVVAVSVSRKNRSMLVQLEGRK